MGGRGHVEADDILHLLGKGRVLRALEGADPMRLKVCSCQIHCTERSEIPALEAMARPARCVTSSGGSGQVGANTLPAVRVG